MSPDELRAALKTVEAMAAAGDFDSDCFCKCLITLAARWLCDHHDPETALVLLNRVPPSYLGASICEHMAADDGFANLCLEFGYRLVQLGLSDANAQLPTMPQGNA